MINMVSNKYLKHVPAVAVALLLILPGFVWIVLDRGIWRGDPCGYALNAVSLYHEMITDTLTWRGMMFNGYKGPLIFWLGQFFIPFGNMIGSVNFALLLIPLASTFVTLLVSFRSFELLFKSKATALCGCLAIAASPLFNGLSTGFWIEPLQVAIVSWFIYALLKVGEWSFYFSLSQFIVVLSLAMLTKVSTPLYIVAPAVVFWITIFRRRPSFAGHRTDLFFLCFSLLFFLPTVVFYLHNFQAILRFAHFAGTSSLFGSEQSKFELWVQNLNNGIFLKFTFLLMILLLIAGMAKTIRQGLYSDFSSIFFIALFQIVIFFIAWLRSSNVDPRYFVPALPYFAILICWGLAAFKNRMLTAVFVITFFIQFLVVTGFAFGRIELNPTYGMIRPLIREPERGMCIMHEIMPFAKDDSSLVFDLNPELGVAEFQYELAKKNLTGNWRNSSIDVGSFFNYSRQEIDAENIDVEMVWEKVIAYNPEYYITWSSRLSSAAVETEVHRIDKYNAVTVAARWAIADRIKKCGVYDIVPFPAYPELLVYKRVSDSK